MTTTTARAPARASAADDPSALVRSPARRLREEFAAARVSFVWLGVRKALTAQQKQEAAEGFGAEGPFLSAGKKLLDTRHPAFRAVTSVRTRAVAYWRGVSLPYPEPGLRLLRQDQVGPFDARMRELADELEEAVALLGERYAELRGAARQRLGRLFDEGDYPASLAGLFALQWDFPGVEPPAYLMRLDPALYEQERARVMARFEEAARLAEQAFTAEFAEAVGHLVERLGGSEDGKPKVFRDSAVANLSEFFERFRRLNVSSDAQLDDLVETARRAVAGVAPQSLRDAGALRRQVRAQLSEVQGVLDQMLVDPPRRRILRHTAPKEVRA